MADQQFPYPVSYGMTRMFRVMHVNVGTYHVEQIVQNGPNPEDTGWKLLAISNHYDPSEALGVMHEAQMVYAVEIRQRQLMIREMSR
jgi:hypothetical protein